MTKETLNSAMLLLTAKVTEQYGLIKDAMARPSEPGDMEKLASMALQLASLENGLAALQTYGESLTAAMDEAHSAAMGEPSEVEVEEDDEDSDEELSPRRLTPEMSSTLKRVTDIHKRQKELKEESG